MTTITVDNFYLHGHHGVSEQERKDGVPLRFRARLEITENASQTDALAKTLDYVAVTSIIENENSKREYKTLERLSTVIAEACLALSERVNSVEVSVVKYEGFDAEYGVTVRLP